MWGSLVFCPTVGANVMVCSPERGPLQQQVLDKASKRADSGAQSLEPVAGWTCKATPTLNMTDAPRPLSRPVRNSLIFKIKGIVVEESKPIVRLIAGFVNKKDVTELGAT
ncbi:hypothetical protein PIB30_043486 [Stylosanthes scabra]|uniref:Uncharacterized protein n=1 Tax=Stylosanthes scabra TaxID=79078 RepID=A0ABU6ZEA6_9FABA|nr:hypothetical protein [Stylosanthes scabra]